MSHYEKIQYLTGKHPLMNAEYFELESWEQMKTWYFKYSMIKNDEGLRPLFLKYHK